jgi:hypothetical protein
MDFSSDGRVRLEVAPFDGDGRPLPPVTRWITPSSTSAGPW